MNEYEAKRRTIKTVQLVTTARQMGELADHDDLVSFFSVPAGHERWNQLAKVAGVFPPSQETVEQVLDVLTDPPVIVEDEDLFEGLF